VERVENNEPKSLRVEIPGAGILSLEHLLLDVNGTIAVDGRPLKGVIERLKALSSTMSVHVITADTYGQAAQWIRPWDLILLHRGEGSEDEQKERALIALGAMRTAAIGNGANDVRMLNQAALGICVIGHEGAAREAVLAADVVIHDVRDALDLLLHPRRLVATLRR
jgi:soluble P-type ATPase